MLGYSLVCTSERASGVDSTTNEQWSMMFEAAATFLQNGMHASNKTMAAALATARAKLHFAGQKCRICTQMRACRFPG